MAETFSDRVSRIAHDHSISGREARRVATSEVLIESLMADRRRALERRRVRLSKWGRSLRIRLSHIEGARYGQPVLIHKGRKP